MMYCVRCKAKTNTDGLKETICSNGRPRVAGVCSICGCKKSGFIAKSSPLQDGDGFLNKILNKSPFGELHLRSIVDGKHNFTGPGTNLAARLDKNDRPVPGSEPVNAVDAVSMAHDICYRDNKDTKTRNSLCDKNMVFDLDSIVKPTFSERVDRAIAGTIIKAKIKLGAGFWLKSGRGFISEAKGRGYWLKSGRGVIGQLGGQYFRCRHEGGGFASFVMVPGNLNLNLDNDDMVVEGLNGDLKFIKGKGFRNFLNMEMPSRFNLV